MQIWITVRELVQGYSDDWQPGNVDFVATTIALNLALEFWAPLNTYLTSIVRRVHDQVDEIQSEIELNRLDESLSDAITAQCTKKFSNLKKAADSFCNYNANTFKYLAVASSLLALCILFLGIECWWNILLISPIVITSVMARIGYHWFKWKANRAKNKVQTDVGNHANGLEELTEDYKLDI